MSMNGGERSQTRLLDALKLELEMVVRPHVRYNDLKGFSQQDSTNSS